MENEILENGTTPETEEVVETVEAVETAAAEAAPEAEKTSVVDTVKGVANNAVAKGKALWADRENLLAKAKELPGKLKTVPKKIWMMIGGGVAALIALIVVLSLLGNTYKTPVKLLQAVENNKNAAAYYNKQVKAVNGLCESELKTIMNIFKKTDDYDDAIDVVEQHFSKFGPKLGEYVITAINKGWIEAENRPKKSATAFCASFPVSEQSRIFMTYGGTMMSVLTLVHELGHAFHNTAMNGQYGLNK